MKQFTYISVLMIMFSFQASTQILNPIKWKFELEKINTTQYNLKYIAKVDKGWTVYSQYTSDDGPVPTSINYESIEGIELVGKAIETGYKKEGMDPFFGVNVIKFTADKPFIIIQKIRVKDASKPIIGYVNFMACDHEKCLPPTDADCSFAIPPDGAAPLNSKTNENLENVKVTGNDEDMAKKDSTSSANIIPGVDSNLSDFGVGAIINGDKIDQKIPSLLSTYESPLSTCGGTEEKKEGLLWTFIFGFIGGLLALLTPCVFPMLPITISFFTKDTKRKGWVNGLIYGASIIVIYVLIGLLITIFIGPEALNRLSTNWIANTLFFVIFIAFAFSFFGFYEITLPSSWSTGSDRLADKGGLIGIFFMAFTLALVSFSCTGPIIGTAIVQAATKGEYMGPFLVMLYFLLHWHCHSDCLLLFLPGSIPYLNQVAG